jgi:hypothetical protein
MIKTSAGLLRTCLCRQQEMEDSVQDAMGRADAAEMKAQKSIKYSR